MQGLQEEAKAKPIKSTLSAICTEISECDVDECPITLDFAYLCSDDVKDNMLPCNEITADALPFKIASNGEKPAFTACKTRATIGTRKLKSCSWDSVSVSSKLGVLWDTETKIDMSTVAFLFRANSLMTPNTDFLPIPFTTLVDSFEFSLEKSEQSTWIAMNFEKGLLDYLEVKTNDNNLECGYALWLYSPPGANGGNELYQLFTIKENDPQQFLENTQYSLQIPAGCSPFIRLGQDKQGENAWYKESQNDCSGTVVVTTPGYRNFDDFDDSNPFLDDYYLDRTIICKESITNMTVELLTDGDVGNIAVTVNAFDFDHNPILDQTCIIDQDTKGCSFSRVGSIQLTCPNEELGETTGLAALVHVLKVDDQKTEAPKTESSTESTTEHPKTTKTPNNCPMNIPLLDATTPAQQFSGTTLSKSKTAVCYKMMECVGDDCSITLDVTFICSNDGINTMMPCDFDESNLPILNALNKEKLIPLHDCMKRPFGNLFLQYCIWSSESREIGLEWDQMSKIDPSTFAFGFHVTQWMEANTIFFPLPFTTQIDDFKLSLGQFDQDVWLAMSFEQGFLSYLEVNLNDNPACIYELWLFSPPGNNGGKEFYKLMTIKENDPIQFLENPKYSLRIPAGCSPMIGLTQDNRGIRGWYDESQGVCAGTALVTTYNYGNEDPQIVNPVNYYLNRSLFCNEFLIDMTVEAMRIIKIAQSMATAKSAPLQALAQFNFLARETK
ncbi:unnamed protein product, partial [Mesorhabditis belari]|uniref:Uncharacterized protein n=1 Tax=Mesorhabditis belari TaxID=2138241 RepID=A0AAF3FLU8_9BILA